jgi:hypothetical protein
MTCKVVARLWMLATIVPTSIGAAIGWFRLEGTTPRLGRDPSTAILPGSSGCRRPRGDRLRGASPYACVTAPKVQRDLAEPDLAEVASALDHILAQQEPYPAVVVDRHWNLLKSNSSTIRLVEFLIGPIAPGTQINLAEALVAPNVLRPYLINWADVVRHFIRTVEADAATDGSIETIALLERLMHYKGVRTALGHSSPRADASPVLAMHFRKRDTSLRLFTTIATLGTPQDITLQELRIECFFPMDDATARLLRNWAEAP